MTCLTQTLGFSVLLTISMLKRSNNNPLSMLHQSLTLQVASLSSGLMVLWWDCAGGIPLRAEQFPLISQSLPQQNRGPEGLVQVMGREPACQLVPLVQVFAIDGTAHLLSFFSQFSVNHHGRQHISFLKMGYRSQKDMKIDDVCGFHLPHHIHHPKKNRVASLPETLHGSNAHVKNRNVLKVLPHCCWWSAAWHLAWKTPLNPTPALRKGVILLKAIHHGLNQPVPPVPVPYLLTVFCVCWTPGQVMPGIHAIFPFFFPSRVTSHRDFFESNQTLLRLSQLSKVNTIDKVRTLQEHCPQRLPLNNQKPSPPSHDPLPRGKSPEAQDLATSLKSAEPNY